VEAVGLAGRLRADAFVLDVRMPKMGGIEAARAIRAGSLDARLLIFSAYEDATLQEDAVAAGVDVRLVKDCPFDDLVVALRG
jgi:DNA-binding NarL/FixJ family response regulator